jgi:hypothetical protein
MNGDYVRAVYFFVGAIASLAVMIYFYENTLLFYIWLMFACAFSFASVVFFSKFKEEQKEVQK